MQKKLLLAEDSVTIQKVFELAFEKSGISVIAVDNGEDAVRMAGEISPDLVVADVTLPGKDGFEVAAAIGGGESTKGVPVLILSGTLVPFDEEKLTACGAKGVLFKPFETAELMEKVEGLLVETEAPRAVAEPSEPPPPVDEHWDFSDVLDEVEEKAPAAKPAALSRPAEEVFPGEILQAAGTDAGPGLDEFDVSIEDLEEPAVPPAQTAGASLTAGEEVPPNLEEAPPVVEEMAARETAALEEFEEIEEIEELEEGTESAPLMETAETQREKEEEIFEEPSAPAFADVPPVPSAEMPVETVEEGPAETLEGAPAETADEILEAELREQFVSRADAIFREVAAEAVEKVMWEMMDRLAGEFSAKIRESVEAVAWEVIPATAEALIREEIARIRTQAGKSTLS